MKRLLLFIILFGIQLLSISQPIEGSTGLLKIPSAEMQVDGTFIVGANFLPDVITPAPFNYNTGNYFFNISFLPFLEFTYRSTFLTWDENHNQDRSFGLRLRLIKETKYRPSIVAGGNDLYTSSAGLGSEYFNSIYGVATKHLMLHNYKIGFTLGYGTGGVRNENLNGVFGGIDFVPEFLPSMRLKVEYDAEVFSAGADLLCFRHIYLFAMAYDLKYFAGGLAYRIYLKN